VKRKTGGKLLNLCILLALGSLPLTGCVHLPAKKTAPVAEPLPDAIASAFKDLSTNSFKADETLLEVNVRYALRRVELSFADKASSNIVIEYYQVRNRKTPSPVIVLLPISGGGYEIENHFARYFAKHGFAVALVHRREVNDETPTALAIEQWLRENISANEHVLDWVQTRPELDPERIGAFGISMGGIQAALLAPLDKRVKAATFGLAAGDVPYVLAHSREKSIARHRAKYLREHGIDLHEFEDQLRKVITYDPVLLAPYMDSKRVLMVLGMWDTVVPFGKGWELRKKLGCPETVLLPTGHYTALLCVPYVKYRCLQFFKRKLEVSNVRPGLASRLIK
jgi:hypothetical protein